MNDRFKFRAWDVKNLKWISDFQIMPDGAIRFLVSNKGKPNKLEWQEIPGENIVLIQSTGLKDKDGKLVYEGDIVKRTEYYYDRSKSAYTYQVTFKEGKFLPMSDDEFNCQYCPDAFGNNPIKYKILGNIYENPELLKD